MERPGALLIAWNAEQLRELPAIANKARRNGYHPVRELTAADVYVSEPRLGPGALGALEIPDESIVCPWTTSLAYATEAVRAGVRLMLSTRVTAVRPASTERAAAGRHEVLTSAGTVRCRWLVNAAGLESDTIDRMLGGGGFSIRPRRGELIVFDKFARPLVRHILLAVPTAATKGVLITPTVYGNVLLGPTAENIANRTDTATTAAGLTALLAEGGRIMPELVAEEVTATYAGVRAATEHQDYQIRVDGPLRYACVAGIRSTGLTASLAIAEHVVGQMVSEGLELPGRLPAEPPVMPYLGEAGQRPYQDAGKIARDPAYGEIVCHCERVTRGEIRDALASTIPPPDAEGLRRRTRARSGRCQGFYCTAEVARLLAGDPARSPGPEQASGSRGAA